MELLVLDSNTWNYLINRIISVCLQIIERNNKVIQAEGEIY